MARRELHFHCNDRDYHFHSRTFQTSQISLPTEDVHLHTHTNRQSNLSIIVPFFGMRLHVCHRVLSPGNSVHSSSQKFQLEYVYSKLADGSVCGEGGWGGGT